MTKAPYCKDCVYSTEVDDFRRQLHCRKNPPIVFPVMSQSGQVNLVSAWPTVKAGDFCGEFKPKSDTNNE